MPYPTSLLDEYPDTDLVHYYELHSEQIPLVSPVPNIIWPNWSEEFKSAARAEAGRTGRNPLTETLRPDLFYTNCETLTPEASLLRPDPPSVPPIKEVAHPSRIRFIAPLNPGGRTPLYKVHLDADKETVYVLKIFRDDVRNFSEMTDADKFEFQYGGMHDRKCTHGYSRSAFEREIAAYARLEQHGVSAAGVVPKCHGWFVVDLATRKLPKTVIKQSSKDASPPRAIILEFLDGMEQISMDTALMTTAQRALEAIQMVHRAFVLHDDIHQRNILVDRSCWRVVIVDFDSASITADFDPATIPGKTGHPTPNRKTVMDEFGMVWRLFYDFLIPNRIIGWDAGNIPGV